MLSKKQITILKYIRNRKYCKLSDIERIFNFTLNNHDFVFKPLISERLVYRSYQNNIKCYQITEKGIAYIENYYDKKSEKESHNRHEWINTAIAVLALLAAFAALFK